MKLLIQTISAIAVATLVTTASADPPKQGGCCVRCCNQSENGDPAPADTPKKVDPKVKPGAAQLGRGPGRASDMAADRDVFHYLLTNHTDIKRTVKNLDNGVETVTESDKKDVASKIQEHAAAMHKRVKEGNGIRLRDPLFSAIFKHYDRIEMTIEKTSKGVKVTETSNDPQVVKLIQAHAEVVSKFVKHGFDETHKSHPVPKQGDKK